VVNRLPLVLVAILSCSRRAPEERQVMANVASSSVCERVRAAGMPPRVLACPPGTNLRVLGGDERRAATDEPGRTAPQSPSSPSVRMVITGLEQQWCQRNGVRHGPFVTRFIQRHIIVHGQYEHGRRIGPWATWTASGLLLRVEQDGRPTACYSRT